MFDTAHKQWHERKKTKRISTPNKVNSKFSMLIENAFDARSKWVKATVKIFGKLKFPAKFLSGIIRIILQTVLVAATRSAIKKNNTFLNLELLFFSIVSPSSSRIFCVLFLLSVAHFGQITAKEVRTCWYSSKRKAYNSIWWSYSTVYCFFFFFVFFFFSGRFCVCFFLSFHIIRTSQFSNRHLHGRRFFFSQLLLPMSPHRFFLHSVWSRLLFFCNDKHTQSEVREQKQQLRSPQYRCLCKFHTGNNGWIKIENGKENRREKKKLNVPCWLSKFHRKRRCFSCHTDAFILLLFLLSSERNSTKKK